MKLTIDSDELAYAFIEPTKEVYKERFDEFKILHNKADYIYKGVIRGVHELIIPSIVLIEVAIVMSRAVGEETAKTVYEKVKKHAMEVLYIDEKFTAYCAQRGIKTHLSGFDTVVFSCVVHADSALVTNDRSFFRNVKKHHPEIKAYFLREMDVDEIY